MKTLTENQRCLRLEGSLKPPKPLQELQPHPLLTALILLNWIYAVILILPTFLQVRLLYSK